MRRVSSRISASALLVSLVVATPSGARAQGSADDRPSILLIVTDDQRWDTLWAMPEVQRSLVERGITFENSFVSSPLCCPSRASILTGAYPHTTGVYTQGPPHGGFRAFDDSTTIATELHDAGYRTGFFGKYLDTYQSAALSGYVPAGWDRWVAFVHSAYFDYGLTVDGDVQRFGEAPADYSTDVLADKTEAFIRNSETPVFAVFAPAAPHAPAIPSPADESGFEDLPVWAPPSFDEPDRSDKPRHMQALRPVGPQRTAYLDEFRRNQYRSLQAVDRAVARLLDALDDTGRLDDALVVFTSDNGLLWGEHRWLKKEVPYEEAIRVPLVIRADGLVEGSPRSDEHLLGNVDLAPTVAEMAGVGLPGAEGESLIPLLEGESVAWRRALLIEHLMGANPIPTYCAVRTPRHLFVTYETGERELYDLDVDPYELHSIAGHAPALEARLATTLRSLCDPPPLGLRNQISTAATLLAVAGVVALAGVARAALRRSHSHRRVA
jgi:N-acetylglucosamine-6-sulfatase